MIILGIETTCDETSVALVENGKKILSVVISSSLDLHKKTGGVVPEIAARKQLEAMIPVLDEALTKAKINMTQVDAISVSVKPGLIGSLLVGVETAKTLSLFAQKPLVPVDHTDAHLYANFLETEDTPKFPAIGLIISGGHTEIYYLKNHLDKKVVGATRDDAVGEVFDKVARIMNLDYPGGVAIDKICQENKNLTPPIRFKRPLINEDNFDFSFSGLKNTVLNNKDKMSVEEICCEFENAVCDVLEKKTIEACLKYNAKSLLIAGGVSANTAIRARFINNKKLKEAEIEVFIPKLEFCTDNAAFVASAGFFKFKPKNPLKVFASSS